MSDKETQQPAAAQPRQSTYNPQEAEIDRMYEAWKNNHSFTNIIKSSTMDRFAPLFSRELADKVLTGKNYRKEDEDEIKILSDEYASLVNLYQPVYVLSDEDYVQYEVGEISAEEASKLAMYVLPPHFMQLHQVDANRDYVTAFNKYSAMEGNSKGTPTAQRRDAMAKAIQSNMGAAVSLEEVTLKAREYAELSQKFMEYNNGNSLDQEESAEETTVGEKSPDAFLDFD